MADERCLPASSAIGQALLLLVAMTGCGPSQDELRAERWRRLMASEPAERLALRASTTARLSTIPLARAEADALITRRLEISTESERSQLLVAAAHLGGCDAAANTLKLLASEPTAVRALDILAWRLRDAPCRDDIVSAVRTWAYTAEELTEHRDARAATVDILAFDNPPDERLIRRLMTPLGAQAPQAYAAFRSLPPPLIAALLGTLEEDERPIELALMLGLARGDELETIAPLVGERLVAARQVLGMARWIREDYGRAGPAPCPVEGPIPDRRSVGASYTYLLAFNHPPLAQRHWMTRHYRDDPAISSLVRRNGVWRVGALIAASLSEGPDYTKLMNTSKPLGITRLPQGARYMCPEGRRRRR